VSKDQAISVIEHDERYVAIEDTFDALDSLDPDADTRHQRLTWPAVVAAAAQLLTERPDLRVALWSMRALVETAGLDGLAKGLECIATLVANRADSMRVDAEESDSPALALAWLGLPEATHRIGKLELDAIQLDISSAALRDDAQRAIQPLSAHDLLRIGQSIEALDAIERAVNAIDPDFQLDTGATQRLLHAASRPASPHIPASKDERYEEHAPIQHSHIDRAAVACRIDELIEWFRRNEPGHPASLLLGRVRRSMSMDFLQLVEELIPHASDGLGTIFGNHRDAQG